MKTIIHLIFISTLILYLSSKCFAAIYEHRYTAPSNIDPNGFAHYKIYIPDTLNTVRGVYCYIPGYEGSSLSIVNSSVYQEYAEEKGFALLGCQMMSNYTLYDAVVSLWSGQAFVDAFNEFAALSNHPELANAPLLLNGHSAGGQFAYHFTLWKPERVIAFATIKGGYHAEISANEAAKVPGYLFTGENDLQRRIDNMNAIFEINRSDGALWALAMQLNTGHERTPDTIIHHFFDQIIPLRLPDYVPDNTIPVLIEINEESGWLGDSGTQTISSYDDFTGDKTKASWFLNEALAKQWQNFIQGNPLTNVKTEQKVPSQFKLNQNYPNPFSPSTHIQYSLGKSSQAKLSVYNIFGQEIKTLVNSFQNAGAHLITWNGTDHSNNRVSSGDYFYSLFTNEISLKRKMVLIQ